MSLQFERATGATHRRVALSLGLLARVGATSGAAIVFFPEWTRWTNRLSSASVGRLVR
jgi:hypothetical protein